MIKIILTIAVVGVALVAFGQGAVNLDNTPVISGATGRLALDTAGNYYAGPFGIEVWYRNGTNVEAAINALNGGAPPSAQNAYMLLVIDGFYLATTLSGQSNSFAGVITLGQLNIPGVTPKGSDITIALAMWVGGARSYPAAENDSFNDASVKGGVINFANPTTDYTAGPTPPLPPYLSGWNSDLIMTSLGVPEPAAFRLVVLGAGTFLLAFRRRHHS